MTDELRATVITDFVLTNHETNETIDTLKTFYKNDNFFTLFEGFRNMTQGYLFGGYREQYTETHIMEGMDLERILYMFNET